MRQVEVTAKSIEEATQLAANELNVGVEEIEIEVIDRPRKILGLLGSGEYHIRAWVREAGTQAPQAATEPEAAQPESEGEAESAPQEEQPAPESGAQVVAQRAVKVCQDIIDLIGLQAEAAITSVEEKEVNIKLEGEGLGLLIGRHGATLDALQLLVAIIANRGLQDGARVIIDAENYRQRRREMLERLAHTQAEKAKRTGKEVVIPDLKAFERRIVHLALADDPHVRTYSEGHGEARQLVISPEEPPPNPEQ